MILCEGRVPYIPILKENNVRKGFFEHNEFIDVRNSLPDYPKPVITFSYKTGWRLSEILNLTWNKVDLMNGIVKIEAGEAKNNEPRTIYLDDELKGVLRRFFMKEKGQKYPMFF